VKESGSNVPSPTPSSGACSEHEISRRRRNSQLCSCRRRHSSESDTPGWTCSGSSMVKESGESRRRSSDDRRRHSSGGSCADELGDYSKDNGACIVIRNSEVLMVQASYFHPSNSWDLPGGTNGDEGHPRTYTCEVAIRETAEEGKIKARPTKSVGGGVFLCTYEGSDNSHHSPEHVNRRWFSLDDYKGLTLRDGWGKGSRNTIINALR